GTEHDAALDLRAETLVARAVVHFAQIARVGGAITVAHAVEAGEVGARFGRGHQVVDRDGHATVRQLDFADNSAESLERGEAFLEPRHHFRVDALAQPATRHADAQARDVAGQRGLELRRLDGRGRAVLRIRTADHVEAQRRVAHRRGE